MSTMDREDDFETMLEASFKKTPRLEPGMKVKGVVTTVGEENVFLDLGVNLDGVLAKEELIEAGTVMGEGDEIECYVVRVRDGAVHCSKRLGSSSEGRAGKEAAVSSLMEAVESRIPVEGKVKEAVKGGVKVSLMGLEAFCPISRLNNAYVEDPSVFIGESLLFRVSRVEEDGRNIVLDRRSLLEEEAEVRAKELWAAIDTDAVFAGTVTSLRPYGAFVDIGGLEGLLHVSEMAHERVDDPADILQVGQKIEVQVKSLDQKARKVSLSLKSLQEHPWEAAIQVLREGQVVAGRVTRLQPFGAFVQIAPGVDGLVHISELGGEKRITHPKEVMAEGMELDVKVLSIDYEKRRISLGVAAADREKEERDRELDEFRTRQQVDGEGAMGTLGDILSKAVKDKPKT